MGSYYYLAPQLPYLVYGQEIPMTSAAFSAMAQHIMSADDAALLDHCTLDPAKVFASGNFGSAGAGESNLANDPPSHSALLNRWIEWEQTLRLNLAKGRAQKLRRDEGSFSEVPESPPDAVAAAKAALAMDSPLEAELYLDKARWNAIDGFQGVDVFSESAMCAYLLKLLLLERKAAFDTESGLSEYKALYTAILGEPK